MTLKIGVIADDFTGATDIASFLVSAGLRAVQLNDPKTAPEELDAEAVVVSLKTRSAPVDQAVQKSLRALSILQTLGAERILFKYCSTFDSTPEGNIGPVTDALMEQLGTQFTVVAPALPVNGRTVYRGHLFVGDQLLAESNMRHHPVTPMLDSNLVRLMQAQSAGTARSISHLTLDKGWQALATALDAARGEGVNYTVLDTLSDVHLRTIGEAVKDLPLTTGGSGLGWGIGSALASAEQPSEVTSQWNWTAGPGVILSGSCSEMTNIQVRHYRSHAPSLFVDAERLIADPAGYTKEVAAWVLEHACREAPLVYATAPPEDVRRLQEVYGAVRISAVIEEFFGELAALLFDQGISRFVAAGGETSGAVTQALGVPGFEVGPQIAPGVPWTRSLDGRVDLALKSGNFGNETFFRDAEEMVNGSDGPRADTGPSRAPQKEGAQK